MSTIRLSRNQRVLSLTAEDDFAADQLHAALAHGQWVRLVHGGVQLADVHTEPTYTDHERLIQGAAAPCFPPADTTRPVQTATIEPNHENGSPSCYVQHIGAYQKERDYAKLYQRMRSVGFNLLRSPRGPDGKMWEVWYLPGLWALNEPLKGASRRALVDWLFTNVSPGTVSFDGESWALTME